MTKHIQNSQYFFYNQPYQRCSFYCINLKFYNRGQRRSQLRRAYRLISQKILGLRIRCLKIQQSLSQLILRDMLQLSENEVTVHLCTFQAFLGRAKVNLRFPSLFFVEWKTINGKNAVSMLGRKRAINSQIQLNETLTFRTEMLYHRTQKQYLKKESLIHLNLISNSRPDQIKLVGRVVVDLSQIANTHKYSTVTTTKLMYCSVDADISFSMKMLNCMDSNLELNELDRSSFSDLYSFTTSLKPVHKNKERKDSISDKKGEEEKRKIKLRNSEREELAIDIPKSPQKEVKMENILIQQHAQEGNEQKSLPHSLPLTEKKLQPLPESEPQIPPRSSRSRESPRNVSTTEFDAVILRQRENLERELNEHKNRIKKLETDIKQVLKLFQQSEQNSELNKSKYLQSEEVINNLRDTEAKTKQFYQKEIANIKELHIREINLLKTGYEADIKILKATIEEQRLKSEDELHNNTKIMEEYQLLLRQKQSLRTALTEQQLKFSRDFLDIQNQNLNFHEEKKNILASIDQKQAQLTLLSQQNIKLRKEIEEITGKYERLTNESKNQNTGRNQIDTIKNDLTSKIEELSAKIDLKEKQNANARQQAEAKIEQTIFEYQQKMMQSSDTLKKVQQENAKLSKELEIKPLISLLSVNPIDINTLQNYNKLKQEHKKLTILLENIKKSIIFPEDELKLYQQQAEQAKPDLFVIMERSQLQEIEISQLKQQNATMRQKMGQLIQQHEQLKSSRNQQQQQIEKLRFEKQSQELDLARKELDTLREAEANWISIQQNFERQIDRLKSQAVLLNQQLEAAKIVIAQNTIGNSLAQILKPQQLIFLQNETNETDPAIKRSQSPQKMAEFGRMQTLQEVHNQQSPVQHDFNFDEHNIPLTQEDLNKITEVKESHHHEIHLLRDENCKLKQQVQQLKSIHSIKENQKHKDPEQNATKIAQLEQQLKMKVQENQSLKQQILALKQNLESTLSPNRQQPKRVQQKNEEQQNKTASVEQEISRSKKVITELQANLTDLQNKYQQLLQRPLENQQIDYHEKENAHIRELEGRLANLEEELKIKDELLLQSERNIEENYAIKYELADLKEKYSQVKSALDQRDEMISYLQETKQQLSKELELAAEKSRHSFHIELKEVLEDQLSPSNVEPQQQNHHQLVNEVEALKKELISLNNNNTNLRSQIEDSTNQKLSIQRINQLNLKKLEQSEIEKRQLQSQVNELSLIINGLNAQQQKVVQSKIENLTSEIQKLSDQLHEFQMTYNALNEQLTVKQQKISQLQRQNVQLKKKIEELAVKSEKIEEPNRQNQIQVCHPEVNINEVESIDEGLPIQYEHSQIPFYDHSHIQFPEQLKEPSKSSIQGLNAQIQTLKQQIQRLSNQLETETKQKDTYFNNLELSNNKILELQVQVIAMKDQIEKLTSLPIQSFAITPTKNRFQHAEAFSKNMRQTSIMYQPRVKGEAEISDVSTPQRHEFSKAENSKNAETRVETKVINESQHELLQQELDMLKEELESEAKLHNELREIHNMCQKKYELINNHYETCLQQLEVYKTENEQLVNGKQSLLNQISLLKQEIERLQNQYGLIKQQHKRLLESNQQKTAKLFEGKQIKHQSNFQKKLQQATFQNNEAPNRQQGFQLSKQLYEKRISDLKTSEQKLMEKINLLEENMFSMERALQQQIQINQANEKVTEKFQQLNELQSMAAHFQQQLEEAKNAKQQIATLKEQRNLLLNEKQQLRKVLEEHSHCIQERAQWQQKLQTIENMLFNSKSKFDFEKLELQNKVFTLNEEKAQLEAQKTVIYENIKKGSELNIDYQIEELRKKQNSLYNDLQAAISQKLIQMQKVAELQEKMNKETQSRNAKEAELQQSLMSKEHEVEQIKFINQQLTQQLQDLKLTVSEKQLYTNNYKEDIKRVKEENALMGTQIMALREKMTEALKMVNEKEIEINNLQQELKFSHANGANNVQTTLNISQIERLQSELSQKVAFIEELQNKLKSVETELPQIKLLLASKNEIVKISEEKISKMTEELLKQRQQNQQIELKKSDLQKEVQILNSRYLELQKAVKNAASAKDKNLQAFRNDITKKQNEISDLSKRVKAKQSDVINLSKQLDNWKALYQKNEQKLKQLIQKQKNMKMTMDIIELQSRKIVQSLKFRFDSEEAYYRKLIQKQRENSRLILAVSEAKEDIANKERIILYQQEKVTQLQSELSILLNNKTGTENQLSPKIVTIQYQKYQKLMQKNDQLLNKNRQYLEIISQKTASSQESEKLKRQIKEKDQKISQIELHLNQAKSISEQKIRQLQNQLQLTQSQKTQLAEKVNQLNNQIQKVKEEKFKANNQFIDKLLSQKDKQITILKEYASKPKETHLQSSTQESADSNINILKQQILTLNQQIMQKDNELQRLKTQIQNNKNTIVQSQTTQKTLIYDEQKQKLRNELQQRLRREEEYKSSIKKLEEQLQKGKRQTLEKSKSPEQVAAKIENISVISHDLHNICSQIKSLCQKRGSSEQTDKLFQSFVQKYDLMEEQFNNLNFQTSLVQEKAKFISKQLQKVKAFIIKGQNRAFKEKTELLALIKPCENAANELVNISETLSEKESQNFL